LTKFFAKHGKTLEFQFEQKRRVGAAVYQQFVGKQEQHLQTVARIAQSFPAQRYLRSGSGAE